MENKWDVSNTKTLMSLDVCGNGIPNVSITILFSLVNSVYSKPNDIFVLT